MSKHKKKHGSDPLHEQLENLKSETLEKQKHDLKVERSIHIAKPGNVLPQIAGLEATGNRMTPDGLTYEFSIAAHIYRNPLNGKAQIMTICSDIITQQVPEQLAQQACQEITMHVARRYGHGPKKTRDKKEQYVEDLVKGFI